MPQLRGARAFSWNQAFKTDCRRSRRFPPRRAVACERGAARPPPWKTPQWVRGTLASQRFGLLAVLTACPLVPALAPIVYITDPGKSK